MSVWKLEAKFRIEGNSKEKDMNGKSCSENKTAEALEDGLRGG